MTTAKNTTHIDTQGCQYHLGIRRICSFPRALEGVLAEEIAPARNTRPARNRRVACHTATIPRSTYVIEKNPHLEQNMDINDQIAAWLNTISPPHIYITRARKDASWEIRSGPGTSPIVAFQTSTDQLAELEILLDMFQDVIMSDSRERWPDPDHDTSPDIQAQDDGSITRVGYSYAPVDRESRQWVAWFEPST